MSAARNSRGIATALPAGTEEPRCRCPRSPLWQRPPSQGRSAASATPPSAAALALRPADEPVRDWSHRSPRSRLCVEQTGLTHRLAPGEQVPFAVRTDRRRHWHDCGASNACRWIRRASQPCDSSTECTRPARPLPIVASEPSNATTVPASSGRHSRRHSRPVTGGRSTRGDSASCPCSEAVLMLNDQRTLSFYDL